MRLTMRQLVKAVQNAPTRSALRSQLVEEVDKFAQYNPTTLTLDNFIKFAAATKSPANQSFKFLSKELPVRFANIMKEFRLLPDQLHLTPSFRIVEDWYEESFSEILQFKDVNIENNSKLEKFNSTLDTLLRRHASVIETMAEGVLEMKESYKEELSERHMQKRIQYFLDRFYLNRIGIRMLIHQHLLLFTDEKSLENCVGAIDPLCDVQAIAEDAYSNARFLCEQYYMSAPECKFDCRNPFEKEKTSDRITMTYVPTHLYHMLFELIKNSLRAIVETHRDEDELPELKILICKGRGDITIKISDQGGGIRRSELASLFSYTYSTAPRPDEHERTPLAGYGYGLPLSHLYARYFNGDLWLNSVDGFGTDAMICLKLLPSDASELLPVYNKTARLKYSDSADPVSDWSDPHQNRGVDAKRSTVGH